MVRMFQAFVISLLACLATPMAYAQTPVRVVMLGDSLTAGFGLAPDAALPAQLEARLTQQGYAIDIINAGVSGDTTANGLARYDWSVSGNDPDMLIIALGANDYLSGLSAESARANLNAIIQRARAQDLPLILVGLEPRWNGVQSERQAAFDAIYPELAETYDLFLFPAMLEGVKDDPALLLPDGLHPTQEGVALIANRLSDYMIGLSILPRAVE